MAKLFLLFAALTGLLFCGCSKENKPSTTEEVKQSKAQENKSKKKQFEDGVYLILRQSAKREEILPVKSGEKELVFNYEFLQDSDNKPKEFLVVKQDAYVPIIIAGKPQFGKKYKGFATLQVQLTQKYSKHLEEFTRKNLQKAVALIINRKVISTHSIRAVITDGKVRFTRCTDNGCEFIMSQLKDNQGS